MSTNVIFYLAIARIPLGTTVALEFLGPVILAAIIGTGWRIRLGILLAIAAGLCWALYMYVGRQIAVTGNGLDSLAIGMLTGSLVWLPVAGMSLGPIFTNQRIFWLVMLVALLSSVTPYAMDTVIMKRINASTFAQLNSLLPATSFLVGLVILHQIPTIGELVGLILITGSSYFSGVWGRCC